MSTSLTEVWNARIAFKTGEFTEIITSEKACQCAWEEWLAYCQKGFTDCEGNREVIIIKGFTDTYDRAEKATAFLAEEVKAIVIFQLY